MEFAWVIGDVRLNSAVCSGEVEQTLINLAFNKRGWVELIDGSYGYMATKRLDGAV